MADTFSKGSGVGEWGIGQDQDELVATPTRKQIALADAALHALDHLHQGRIAQRFRQPLSLIAMDIDDFKNINDHYGHALGDAALVQVVESVKHCVREGDLLVRWGGDEFILILPNTPLADARALAERIRHDLASLLPVGDFQVTMSFGVVQRFEEEQKLSLIHI